MNWSLVTYSVCKLILFCNDMVITLQALQLKEETATVEMKEQQLVLDCVKQLGVLISIQIKYY